MLWAQDIKDVTPRRVGTGVSNRNDVTTRVKVVFGLTLGMAALESDAATQPDSFDIGDIENRTCKKGLADRQFAGDRHVQNRQLRQDRRYLSQRQSDTIQHECAGHRAEQRRLCLWPRQHRICARGIRLDDTDPDEFDLTPDIFTEARKNGQVCAVWTTIHESVNLMASGKVVIQSMWSRAITAVKSRGIPCVYQPLEEGYRSWGRIGLSSSLSGLELDAASEPVTGISAVGSVAT